MFKITIENEILILTNLAILFCHKHRGIEVKICFSVIMINIPSKSNKNVF